MLKMVKPRALIVFSVILALFLAGCGRTDTSTTAPTTPFIGGDGGLEIKFLEGNPPAEVTDAKTFPFQAIVSLKNTGEQNIPKNEIKVSLVGFMPEQFKSSLVLLNANFDLADLSNRVLTEDLKGRKRDAEGNIVEPAESFLVFPKDGKNFAFEGDVRGNTIFTYRAEACYKYTSQARSELCVLRNQVDPPNDAICNPTGQKDVFSSASPIKITSLRQSVAGQSKLQFSFDITHPGAGKLFSLGIGLTPEERTKLINLDIAIAANEDAINKVKANTMPVPAIDTPLTGLLAKIVTANVGSDRQLKINELLREVLRFLIGPNPEFKKVESNLQQVLEILKQEKADLEAKTLSCPQDPANRRAKEDIVSVTVDTGLLKTSGYILNCVGLTADLTNAKSTGTIRLIGGKRTLTCVLDLPSTRTDFKKPIDITADFNYLQKADTQVLVKHILTEP